MVQKRNFASKKHKRVIKMAKGYRGRANRTFRAAIRRVEKGLQYAYRDRKVKKRNYRKLWIERVNAGVRQHGMSYSRFINGMQNLENDGDEDGSDEDDSSKVRILLDRKVLADLAANEPFSFKAVVDVVKMKVGEQK
jgi:large subunit ribosomal protein L20